jgi:hypothetical protein
MDIVGMVNGRKIFTEPWLLKNAMFVHEGHEVEYVQGLKVT